MIVLHKEDMIRKLDELGSIVDPLLPKLKEVPEEAKIEPRQTPVLVNVRSAPPANTTPE